MHPHDSVTTLVDPLTSMLGSLLSVLLYTLGPILVLALLVMLVTRLLMGPRSYSSSMKTTETVRTPPENLAAARQKAEVALTMARNAYAKLNDFQALEIRSAYLLIQGNGPDHQLLAAYWQTASQKVAAADEAMLALLDTAADGIPTEQTATGYAKWQTDAEKALRLIEQASAALQAVEKRCDRIDRLALEQPAPSIPLLKQSDLPRGVRTWDMADKLRAGRLSRGRR